MLNKDQYNQDEYNDYYARATEGAEIHHNRRGERSGKKILFILLLLLFIGALAYFVVQALRGSSDKPEAYQKAETTQEKIEIAQGSTPAPQAATPATKSTSQSSSTQESMTQQVTEAVVAQTAANGQSIDPVEMAKIVQAVMASMNQDQTSGETSSPVTTTQDTQLMAELSSEEESLLSGPDTLAPTISESDSKKEASTGETVDTYNKVVVNDSEPTNDGLSQMASALSDIVEEGSTEGSTYTQSITKEVSARKKEMRFWVVKRGDTLGKIAKEVYGNVMDYKKIYRANPDILRRPDRIYIGQKLRIPEER